MEDHKIIPKIQFKDNLRKFVKELKLHEKQVKYTNNQTTDVQRLNNLFKEGIENAKDNI